MTEPHRFSYFGDQYHRNNLINNTVCSYESENPSTWLCNIFRLGLYSWWLLLVVLNISRSEYFTEGLFVSGDFSSNYICLLSHISDPDWSPWPQKKWWQISNFCPSRRHCGSSGRKLQHSGSDWGGGGHTYTVGLQPRLRLLSELSAEVRSSQLCYLSRTEFKGLLGRFCSALHLFQT